MADNYPKNLVDEYLKACSYLKKVERVVFKRFGPKISDVRNEYARLAHKFEEAEIYSYAAMCHLGVAKCEATMGKIDNECEMNLKAARAFLAAHNQIISLNLRYNRTEFLDGALRCYNTAIEKCPDDSVLKAAIIREMTPLQPFYEATSSFASPAHQIYELEISAHNSIEKKDFFAALQSLDDIIDNITERKKEDLYEDLLKRVDVLRLLLLVALNLPPSRQSPSHIKMIEYYYQLASFELDVGNGEHGSGDAVSPDRYKKANVAPIPLEMQYALGDIIVAWIDLQHEELKMFLKTFKSQFKSLNSVQRFVIDCIYTNINKEK